MLHEISQTKESNVFSHGWDLDLKCVCDEGEDICNCTYNNRIIKCPKNLVTVSVPSEENPEMPQ